MKEISIEEKAKRYDEAIKKAKSKIKNDKDHVLYEHDVIEIFPELAKSEDKMIMKKIIATIHLYYGEPLEDEAKEMIAWIEQQGEQKSTIFIPKFHVGDKLVSTKNPRLTYEVLEVGHINELGNTEYKVEIFTDGKAKNLRNIHYMECYKVEEWAKLIEQKPTEWSKEDEKLFKLSLENLTELKDRFGKDYGRVGDCIDWLKSIRPQATWRPSEEQIYTLEKATHIVGSKYKSCLASLYQELKKLKG